jgi:toxin HigB-1
MICYLLYFSIAVDYNHNMGWHIVEGRLIAKQLERAPKSIRVKYSFWRSNVREMGPNLQGGYRTHALKGDRAGQKSARLDKRWRVIFQIFEHDLIVEALEVTPHNY